MEMEMERAMEIIWWEWLGSQASEDNGLMLFGHGSILGLIQLYSEVVKKCVAI